MPAPAKAGAIAPCDVFIPAGPTAMPPEMTNFFQALNINTKISKGKIEILKEVHIIVEGEKVQASEATLLAKLGIVPFSYGLVIQQVYDEGSIFEAKVLDITNDDIFQHFTAGLSNISCLSLAMSYPTAVSVPHMLANGLKNCLALAAVTDIEFKEAETIK